MMQPRQTHARTILQHTFKIRPVARSFRRGVTWMSNLHKHKRLGGSGGMLPQEMLDALRLLLRPF